MIGFRPALFVLAALAVVVGVSAIDWSRQVRETRLDGTSQREYLILGRFKRTTEVVDPRIEASVPVKAKLKEYGLSQFCRGDLSAITLEGRKTDYSCSGKEPGDLRKEADRIAKELPWLTLIWHGAKSTGFTAHGYHPSKKGYVSISMGQLPERKHGKGMAHLLTRISE